jgi:hypothetical protein
LAAVNLRKKQCPEISNANLANQLKKVLALNADDSLLQATQMTDLDHEDKEEEDDETLKVTKYLTIPVSGKNQSLWWEGFEFLSQANIKICTLSTSCA